MTEIGNYGAFFYPPDNPENQNFEKMKKASGDVITLHMCTKNHNHMMYASWDMECNRQFLHFGPFLLLPHDWPQKFKSGKNVIKTPGDIIILQMCTKNEDHMYGSWDIKARQAELSFWAIFCPLTLKNQSQKSKFWKSEINAWRYYHCTMNDDHMMDGSWDMEHSRHNFLSICRPSNFALLPPSQPGKSKCWKMKKHKTVNDWR